MANIKVTQLPIAKTVSSNDLLMIISQGNAKEVSFSDLWKSVTSDLVVNNTNLAAALVVKGTTSDELLVSDPIHNRIGVGTSSPKEMFHVMGNIKLGDDTHSGMLLNSREVFSVSSSLSNDRSCLVSSTVTEVVFVGTANTQTIRLNAGTIGQTKTILIAGTPIGNGTVLVVPSPYVSSIVPQIILSKPGDSITFYYTKIDDNTNGWVILSKFTS